MYVMFVQFAFCALSVWPAILRCCEDFFSFFFCARGKLLCFCSRLGGFIWLWVINETSYVKHFAQLREFICDFGELFMSAYTLENDFFVCFFNRALHFSMHVVIMDEKS